MDCEEIDFLTETTQSTWPSNQYLVKHYMKQISTISAMISLRFQKLAAEQYGFISNGGHGQGNTLHLDTLKENLLRLNIYFSTLNVHTVTGVVNTPFLETINRPTRTDRTGNLFKIIRF